MSIDSQAANFKDIAVCTDLDIQMGFLPPGQSIRLDTGRSFDLPRLVYTYTGRTWSHTHLYQPTFPVESRYTLE